MIYSLTVFDEVCGMSVPPHWSNCDGKSDGVRRKCGSREGGTNKQTKVEDQVIKKKKSKVRIAIAPFFLFFHSHLYVFYGCSFF